eukprot:952840-Amphidinium_carterae.1
MPICHACAQQIARTVVGLKFSTGLHDLLSLDTESLQGCVYSKSGCVSETNTSDVLRPDVGSACGHTAQKQNFCSMIDCTTDTRTRRWVQTCSTPWHRRDSG